MNQIFERTQMRMVKVMLLVVLALLIGVVVYESRETAEKRHADNTLKQIGMALQNYHSTHSEPASNKEPDKDNAEGP